MEEIINYLKKTAVRKGSSVSKIRPKLIPHPNLSDYTGIKMKNNIKEIYNSLNDYNLKLKRKTNELIKAQTDKSAKENIILSLRKDLNFHKNINKNFNIYKQYSDDVCDYYKQNFEEIYEFKAKLKYDLRDFIKVLDGYEDQIAECIKNKKAIIKTSEDLIVFKKNEQEKMVKQLTKLNYDLEIQGEKLSDITEKLNNFKTENEENMLRINNNELHSMENYEMLEAKYKILVAKYDFYINKELKRRKLELEYKDKNLCKEEEDLADLKLQDQLVQNIFLKNIAKDIKKQIEEVELAHKKYLEEEEEIKFLGKVFFNKVKQRRMEKELLLTQENENKSNKNTTTVNSKTRTNTRPNESKNLKLYNKSLREILIKSSKKSTPRHLTLTSSGK